jgi:hypothetical protein
LRSSCFTLLLCFLTLPVAAQFGEFKIKWVCPKEGRFRVAHCKDCPWHYCYDGQHFYQEDGPVPSWVKTYFDNIIKKMDQDRADMARKIEEGKAQSAQAKIDTARQSEEAVRKSKEWNDELKRKIAEQHSGVNRSIGTPLPPPPSAGRPQSYAYQRQRVLSPSMQVVSVEPATPAHPELAPQPVSPEKFAEVKIGMERDSVIESLGVPQSSISIPEDTGVVETMNYLLTNGRGVKVRLLSGRVSEIKQ